MQMINSLTRPCNEPLIRDKLNMYRSHILSLLPEELRKEFIENAYFAGGLIRSLILGENVVDVDVWLKRSYIIPKLKKLNLGFTTDNSINFNIMGNSYQIIIKDEFIGRPIDVTVHFDFIMNCNYYDLSTEELFINNLNVIKGKQLVFNRYGRNSIGTLARLYKFINRGYKIPSKEELLFIGTALTKEAPINTFEELQKRSCLCFSDKDYEIINFVRKITTDKVRKKGGSLG